MPIDESPAGAQDLQCELQLQNVLLATSVTEKSCAGSEHLNFAY